MAVCDYDLRLKTLLIRIKEALNLKIILAVYLNSAGGYIAYNHNEISSFFVQS